MCHRSEIKFIIVICAVCLMLATFVPCACGEKPYPNVMNRSIYSADGSIVVRGSTFTRRRKLVSAIDDILANGNISIYSDYGCTNSVRAPLGDTSAVYPDIRRYVGPAGGNALWNGESCYIYAMGVYYTLFGDCPQAGIMNHTEALGSFSATYSEFCSHNVRREPGAMLRLDDAHSLIVLSYDETGINTLEGNAIERGLVLQNYYTWDVWAAYFHTVNECYQPRSDDYEALYSSDNVPPVISRYSDYELRNGVGRVVFAVTDNRAVNPQSIRARVWEYGRTLAEAQSLEVKSTETANVYEAKIDITSNESLYYLQIDAEDMVGNPARPQHFGPYSSYKVDKSGARGVYLVTKEEIAVRRAPYENINGAPTWVGSSHDGCKVQVVGSYRNKYNHEWYLLSDGNWIYSENLVRLWSLKGMLANLLDFISSPSIYFMHNQALHTTTIVTEARTYSSANDFDNDIQYNDGYTIRMSAGRAETDYSDDVQVYTVRLDGNGGFAESDVLQVAQGESYGELPEANRFGFALMGWYTEPEGGDRIFETDLCEADITLYAHWAEQSGDYQTCGENLCWTLSDGLLEIEGFGEMTSAPWLERSSEIVKLILPRGLTSIFPDAFKNCTALEEVTMPCELADAGTFENTDKVRTVHFTCGSTGVMPDFAEARRFSTLTGASLAAITSVDFEEGITHIGDRLFGEGRNFYNNDVYGVLKTVQFPSTLQSIGYESFSRQRSLQADLSDCVNLKSLGDSSFYGCESMTGELVIPDSMTELGGYTFYGCSGLTRLVIPKSVTEIGSACFAWCTGLEEVTMPCELADAIAFEYTSKVRIVHFTCGSTGIMPDFESLNRSSVLTGASLNSINSVDFEEGVVHIGDRLFGEGRDTYNSDVYGRLTTVQFPSTLQSIGNDSFSYQGSLQADLSGCVNLESLGGGCFRNCSSMTSAVLPESLTEIGADCFYGCQSLAGVLVIPKGVIELKSHTFRYCAGLTGLVIHKGITSIGSGCFAYCTGLKEVTIPCELADADAFENTDKVRTVHFTCGSTGIMPDFAESRRFMALTGASLAAITAVDFEEGITHIGDYLLGEGRNFYNNNVYGSLTTVQFPSTLQSIGYAGFSHQNLPQLDLSSYTALKSLGGSCFSNCGSLTSVILPENLESLGGYCFAYCGSLTEVEFLGDAPEYGQNTFHRASYGAPRMVYYNSDKAGWTDEYREALESALVKPVRWCDRSHYLAFEVDALELFYTGRGYCEQATLSLKIAGLNAESVVWASDDAGVASVENGVVRAMGPGTATITVFSGEYSDECVVTVTALRVLRLPVALTWIESEAFRGAAVEYVELPQGCSVIGEAAFADCESLQLIRIPSSVTNIAENAFENCTNLRISCPSNSEAAQFADINGIPYSLE